MNGSKATEHVIFAVVTECKETEFQFIETEEADAETGKKLYIQQKTTVPIFQVPCIVPITKGFERTLDGRGLKMYRHDIDYEVYETFEDALKRYCELSDNRLPNGLTVEADAYGVLRVRRDTEEE